MKKIKLLVISTPVAPIGSGHGGGVETILINLLPLLANRGFDISVLAPSGSKKIENVKLIKFFGDLTKSAVVSDRNEKIIIQKNGVIENMWKYALNKENQFDLILSFSYDWFSFFASKFFSIPVLHAVSLSATINEVDKMMRKVYESKPRSFALLTQSQAKSFRFFKKNVKIISGGVNLKIFKFNNSPKDRISWAARISREKGLEDAFEVAKRTNLSIDICGIVEDNKYWQNLKNKYKGVKYTYHGFVTNKKLGKILGNSKVFLATHKWTEAFGNTTLEALATGTPVITYKHGGPSEIVQNNKNGFLVKQNNIQELCAKVRDIEKIKRLNARKRAEQFSYQKMGAQYSKWLKKSL